jgi:penicillin-binding protein 2
MYNQRVKVFIAFYALLLLVMVLRLAQMQLLPSSEVLTGVQRLKGHWEYGQQTMSIRGSILDRNEEILASEEAVFKLYVDYGLTCYEDRRVRQALLTSARQQDNKRQRGLGAKTGSNREQDKSLRKAQQKIEKKRDIIQRLLTKAPELGVSEQQLKQGIQKNNERIWNKRLFYAWNRHCKDSQFHQENKHRINSVWDSEAKKDFAKVFVDPNERIRLTAASEITADLQKPFALITLDTDDQVLAAQLEFLDVNDVEVRTEAVRRYPFKNAAAHTIGWIGYASAVTDPFAEDRRRRYRDGELSGRDDGVEYVCEAVLRGSRGERVRDIDQNLQQLAQTEHGRDVQLTLDIRLQQRIEHFLANEYPHADHCNAGFAAVVLDVPANEILALVSIPTFDPARVRHDYADLVDPNKNPKRPLRNRAINEVYPPGSVAKPLVAVAGLESGSIKPNDVISCPTEPAPAGWPNCVIFRKGGYGHDVLWPDNNVCNAIRGSCNIYFSHLANRMDPKVLQQWFFRFGYGRHIKFNYPRDPNTVRRSRLDQAAGWISSERPPYGLVDSLEQIPELKRYERPNAGIGQASIRVTPLQVANSMATLARLGVFKHPRLFKREPSSEPNEPLNLSEQTLRTVTDGLDAVVNEVNGTAYDAFGEARQSFKDQGVRVYGKTGSTENPEHAWFAGYARDYSERCLAVAVLAEGGQSGARDATPLARDIIQFCITHKYLGHD